MGVSVHYRGAIEVSQIVPLSEEIRDIAGSLRWDSHDIDDAEKGLRGIILSSKSDLEAIAFLFDSKGRLHSVGDLIAGWSEGDCFCAAVKTQFAGSAEHMWLCGLLRHIQRTWFPGLSVTDEGGFWDSGDRRELQRRMDCMDRMIVQFGAALEQASMDTVLDTNDPNAIADFIEQTAEYFRKGSAP